MLSMNNQQAVMVKRIEATVTILMEERPLFKEELNYEEMVQHLTKLFTKNLPFEEFNSMPDAELKEHCAGILSIELMSGMLNDFTPEEMAIFEDAIKRK